MNKRAVALLVSAAMLCAPASAYAACVQANLAGTWQLYQVTGATWIHCKVTISHSGVMDAAPCQTSSGAALSMLPGGSATLVSGPDCVFTAQYQITNQALSNIEHATLSRDKLTAAGVGASVGGSARLTIAMIKR